MSKEQTRKAPTHGRPLKTARVRMLVILGVIALAAVGFFTAVGVGNLCAGGIGDLVLLCPLGALASMIAQHTIIPQAVVSLVFAAIALLIFGRFFCSWICPTPLLQKILPKKGGRAAKGQNEASTCEGSCKTCAQACGKSKGVKLDSRHAILAAALISTLIFGFPVFCLVCPVGLTFAGVLLIMRLFAFGEATWTIVAVFAVLIAEIIFLPRWCQNICPLGALQSLVSAGNRTFVPTIDTNKCLKTTKGIPCDLCTEVCAEGINLHDIAAGETTLADCTKCRDCADVCPANAISFPTLPKKQEKTAPVIRPDFDSMPEAE